jgi:hypothetical protein
MALSGTDGDITEALAALAAAQARLIVTTVPAVNAREAIDQCVRLLRLWCAAGYRA